MSEGSLVTYSYGDVEFDDDMALYEGAPISGVLIGWWGNGAKDCEYHYVDGLKSGWQTEWFSNGQLKRETYVGEDGHVSSREWYENGSRKLVRLDRDYFNRWFAEWDGAGLMTVTEYVDGEEYSQDQYISSAV
jgi:hypothetical protein